jgi:hypothetical protein
MPMNPEFLPEFALLIAGVLLGGVAMSRLASRRWSSAAKLAVASVALIAVAFLGGKYVHWKYSESWRLRQTMKRHTIEPSIRYQPDGKDPEAPNTTSLLLGGVRVQVVASDRFVFSVDHEPFLTLDSLTSGLLVTCDVAGSHSVPIRAPRLAARISQNVVWYSGPGVSPMRPDPHTILVRERGKDILRIRYVDPRRIEVTGQFYLTADGEPSVISLMHGLNWRGGIVREGTGIDLRLQGKGKIDFERIGLIQILPK